MEREGAAKKASADLYGPLSSPSSSVYSTFGTASGGLIAHHGLAARALYALQPSMAHRQVKTRPERSAFRCGGGRGKKAVPLPSLTYNRTVTLLFCNLWPQTLLEASEYKYTLYCRVWREKNTLEKREFGGATLRGGTIDSLLPSYHTWFSFLLSSFCLIVPHCPSLL